MYLLVEKHYKQRGVIFQRPPFPLPPPPPPAIHTTQNHSNRYGQKFRMHCRTVLDGKPQDVPLNVGLGITNALRYHELHSAARFFDFQLRRIACVHKLKRLCTVADYPSPPDFMTCSDLREADARICLFQHDPIYTEDGTFMTDADVEAEQQKKKMFLWERLTLHHNTARNCMQKSTTLPSNKWYRWLNLLLVLHQRLMMLSVGSHTSLG